MPGPAGEVRGPLGQRDAAPAVGAFIADVSGDERDAEREVGGQFVDPAAQDVALVDERGDDARRSTIGVVGHDRGRGGDGAAARPSVVRGR